ncbi:MAG: hypothetical protein Q4D71_15370 [Oscillospiraceae bacterium]|nr:hypothetical protein [Oscillospiraceae bacterium]
MNADQLYEYQMLREEIMENIKTQSTLSSFSLTLVLTVLTFCLSNDVQTPYVYAIPLLILLPCATKTYQLRKDIMTLSAYLAVRLESKQGIFWETMLNKFRHYRSEKREPLVVIFECSEYAIAGVICVIFYIKSAFYDPMTYKKATFNTLPIAYYATLIIAVAIAIYLSYLSYDYMNMDHKHIENVKEVWNELLDKDDTLEKK